MRRHHVLVYAIALAVVVGVVFTDLSATTLLLALVILACPLMMIFMMRDMHGGRGDSLQDPGDHADHHHDHPAGPGQPS